MPPLLSQARGVALCLVAAALSSCAADGTRAARDLIQIPLKPTSVNVGATGQATLVAMGESTEIAVLVSGVPPLLASRPVHLYTYLYPGSCASPGAQPAYALTAQVLAQSPSSNALVPAGGPYTVTNVAPAPFASLRGGRFALRIFTSPADGRREIFCGDING